MIRILLSFCLLLTSCALYASTIAVLGDSLSAGYGMTQEQSWVTLLQQKLDKSKPGWKVINASTAGATSANAMAELPRIFKKHHPDILIIQVGGNDGLRGLSLNQLKTNIAAMIVYARLHHAKVLLLGVRLPPNYGPEYSSQMNKIYSDIGRNWHIAVVPQLLKNIAENPSNMQRDGIHPTAAAQPLILKNIWPTLTQLL